MENIRKPQILIQTDGITNTKIFIDGKELPGVAGVRFSQSYKENKGLPVLQIELKATNVTLDAKMLPALPEGNNMQQVNVFIETSSRFRGNVERKCGYVLSTQLRTGKETREHFGRVTGTYHQAILLTMVDALNHMTRTCDVCFYISDLYVTSRLGKITEMAGSGWLDTKGKPIANREEWRRLFKAINQLPDPHKISAKTEKHSYSAWLREEMKHRECGRILGQGLEPAPGARQINNGMSGYHY